MENMAGQHQNMAIKVGQRSGKIRGQLMSTDIY